MFKLDASLENRRLKRILTTGVNIYSLNSKRRGLQLRRLNIHYPSFFYGTFRHRGITLYRWGNYMRFRDKDV